MPEHTHTLSNCHSVPNGPHGTLRDLMPLRYQKKFRVGRPFGIKAYPDLTK